MRTLLLVSLLPFAAAAWSTAQAPQLTYERRFCSQWLPVTPNAMTFEKVVAGKFSPDWDRDACVLVRDHQNVARAAYLPDASRFNAPIWLSRANDISVLRAAGPNGQDVLLVQDGNTTLEFTDLDTDTITSNTFVWPGTSPQPALQRLFAVTDTMEQQWVLGLDVNGMTLHRAVFDPVAAAFTNAGTITVLNGTREILEMDYDADGNSELVLLVTYAGDDCVFVMDFDATTLIDQIWMGQSIEDGCQNMVAVSRGTGVADMLVLYGWNGQQHLLVTKSAGQLDYCLLGDFPAKSISAARHDSDALEDIALGHANESRILVVHRTALALAVGGVAELTTPLGLGDSAVDMFVMDDLDQDGDGDMLGFQNATKLVHTFDDGTKRRRPVNLDADIGSIDWHTPVFPMVIPVTMEMPELGGAGPVQILTEIWTQADGATPFASGKWCEWPHTGAATQVNVEVPALPSGVDSEEVVLHLHIRLIVNGVQWPSALLYVMFGNGPSQPIIESMLESENASPDPVEGDGSLSGNKGNKPPPTDPPN